MRRIGGAGGAVSAGRFELLDGAGFQARHDLAEHQVLEVGCLAMRGERFAGIVALQQHVGARLVHLAIGDEAPAARLGAGRLQEPGQQGEDFLLHAGLHRVASDHKEFRHRIRSREGAAGRQAGKFPGVEEAERISGRSHASAVTCAALRKSGKVLRKTSNIFLKIFDILQRTKFILRRIRAVFRKTKIVFPKTSRVFRRIKFILRKTKFIFRKIKTIFQKTARILRRIRTVLRKMIFVLQKTGAILLWLADDRRRPVKDQTLLGSPLR